jgi:putative ABC transport system permease protein
MVKLFLLARTAWLSLLMHKVRSFLSILGVICGVMAVMSMISIGEGAKQKVLKEIEGLGLRNVYINHLDMDAKKKGEVRSRRSYGVSWFDVDRLLSYPSHIKEVAALREVKEIFHSSSLVIVPKIVQSTPNYLQILGVKPAEGRYLLPSDETGSNLVCVLGAALAGKIGSSGKVGRNVRIGDTLYRVVGILSEQNFRQSESASMSPDNFNETVFLPFGAQKERAGSISRYQGLSRILVEVRDGDRIEEASRLIHRVLEVAHNGVTDYQVVVPMELLKQSLQTQKIFNLVLAIIGGISLFVGGVGIMNIMLATVSERRNEIGLRRSIGATRQDVVVQFLTESVLLTLTGGILGISVGTATILVVQATTGWPVSITFRAMFIPFGLALSTGLFFGMYPAVKAAYTDPIEALNAA